MPFPKNICCISAEYHPTSAHVECAAKHSLGAGYTRLLRWVQRELRYLYDRCALCRATRAESPCCWRRVSRPKAGALGLCVNVAEHSARTTYGVGDAVKTNGG
jgi:hypothetical protein